jgi:hypothetical protein
LFLHTHNSLLSTKTLRASVSLCEILKVMNYTFRLLILLILSFIPLSASESLLNIQTLRDAKEVEIKIFNKETGKPSCNLKYESLERSKPKLGPLTVNLDVIRLQNLRLEIDLSEPTTSELFPELHRFAKSRPFHFIDASPASIEAKKDTNLRILIKAGRAKFHRKGGFSLHEGVSWKVYDEEGQTPEALLIFDPVKNSWMLLTPEQQLLSNFRL